MRITRLLAIPRQPGGTVHFVGTLTPS